MQLQSRLNNHSFTKNIIDSTTKFIDKTFDFTLGELKPSTLLQMPLTQLQLFSDQSLQNSYKVIITMLNEEQFQGKIIRKVNSEKYVLKIASGFYKIIDLNQLKSINQA